MYKQKKRMFSKPCRYGIRAVIYLAVNASEEQKVGSSEMAEQLDIPRPFLAKILQKLVKADMISSIKGPGGGFYLRKPQFSLSLVQIIECLDGTEVFSKCVLGFSSCSEDNPCPLHLQAYAYREGLRYQLVNHTIEDMALRIERQGLKI